MSWLRLGLNRASKRCPKENIQKYREYTSYSNTYYDGWELSEGIVRSAQGLAANTEKFLEEFTDCSIQHTEHGNSSEQLNAQMMYHQIRTPFKLIQRLLTFYIVANDSNHVEEKFQQLSKELQ